MRLPNNYGCVTKLKGKRRNPWMVRKRINEYDSNGKRKMKVIGYARTRSDALDMLAAYNGNPYDLTQGKPTFAEVYEKWFKDTFANVTNRSTLKNYTSAYKHFTSLYNMKMVDIRTADIQDALDACPAGYCTAGRMRGMVGQIYRWAMRYDIVTRNYAEGLIIHQENVEKERDRFSSEEIKTLWNNVDQNDYIKLVLIYCYCGVRTNELLNLNKENVHLEERYFEVIKSKTKAGKRIVPIAEKVYPYWEEFYERSKCDKVICTPDGDALRYDNFKRRYWDPLMKVLGMEHIPYETRHTCSSMLHAAGVDKTTIKFILGHKGKMDLTERVYTHLEIQQLIDAINKI